MVSAVHTTVGTAQNIDSSSVRGQCGGKAGKANGSLAVKARGET